MKVRSAIWHLHLAALMWMAGYPCSRRKVGEIVRFAFEPCWAGMREDGYTPREALDCEFSYGEG